jgi:hypothetical protein
MSCKGNTHQFQNNLACSFRPESRKKPTIPACPELVKTTLANRQIRPGTLESGFGGQGNSFLEKPVFATFSQHFCGLGQTQKGQPMAALFNKSGKT